MRYKFEIKFDMDKDELNQRLKENYGYSLINFAYVIADVLAEDTIFNKTISGRKLSDIKEEIETLKKIKRIVIKSLDNYFIKYYDPDFPHSKIENYPELKEMLYGYNFKLEQFFNYVDNLIKPKKEIIDMHDKEVPFPWPGKSKYTRPFSNANQISLLWSRAMRSPVLNKKKFHIQWANICNLISWFIESLEGSSYVSKLYFRRKEEIAGYPKVLKNLYRKIINVYGIPLVISEMYIYFPYGDRKPLIPCEKTDFSDSIAKGYPVTSIKFYENNIKTIFKKNGKLIVRETLIEKSKVYKYYSQEQNYDEDEEHKDVDKLLLNIS